VSRDGGVDVAGKEPAMMRTMMPTMMRDETLLYTARTHTTGGRERGAARSDGRLDVKLSVPGGLGMGTNPEQLLAAGWSACFESAMALAARRLKVALPVDLAIDAEVDLNLGDGGYFLRARLNVTLPGVDSNVATALLEGAHEACPYSRATRGNIGVTLKLL
jgi:Ohr subfamily peroxiredoxin